MSEFYDNMAITAARLIGQFGLPINLKRTVGDGVDPVTGAETAGVETVYTPNGIFKEYDEKLIDGTRIQSGDRMLILDNTIEPIASDEIEIDGNYWNVVSPIKAKSPAGIPLVYIAQVRS